MKYKFRCETPVDIFKLCTETDFGKFVQSIHMERLLAPGLPDMLVTVEIYWSLAEVREAMRQVEDGHVMVETVAIPEQYTGERAYQN